MNHEEMQTELDTLKRRIAEIEAQMNEPEWVPFPGEIVEVSDAGKEWVVRKFYKYKTGEEFPYVSDFAKWGHARPLSDPNVIQFRPHTPGDPMPCSRAARVVVRLLSGEISSSEAGTWVWEGITAWAPLP